MPNCAFFKLKQSFKTPVFTAYKSILTTILSEALYRIDTHQALPIVTDSKDKKKMMKLKGKGIA
ncbi:hypothetical protein DI487_15850 [Flavobacterium sediminis]|uniref:Uncharacterized protein n=1 Tax=Flavobacterium sediminis TaxID=2201181 RepID=A0A2U8QZ91_9FLAO|nr:hypothetical protein DI487_15850 [Flavobacterium sediminis]